MYSLFAEVAELADAPGSGPGGGNPVGVQIPSSAFLLIILSLILSIILTPIIKNFIIRWNILDIPKEERKIHKKPVPTMGGLSIILSFFISSSILALLSKDFSPVLMVIISLPLIIIAVIDDIKGMPVWIRLIVQILSSLLFVFLFPIPEYIKIPFLGYISGPVISKVVGVIWIVLIINSINFIDGIDGLAGGMSIIVCVIFSIASLIYGNHLYAILSLILAASAMGFLFYNLPPAVIFMGDTGSNFLGFMIGGLALIGAGKMVSLFGLLIPIFALAVPIMDMLTAIFRRSYRRKAIFHPDREDIHHKLLDRGFSNSRILVLLYSVTFTFGMLGLIILKFSWLFIGGMVLGAIGVICSLFLHF